MEDDFDLTIEHAADIAVTEDGNSDYPDSAKTTNIVFFVQSLSEHFNYEPKIYKRAGNFSLAVYFNQLRGDVAVSGGKTYSGAKLKEQRAIAFTELLHDAFDFRKMTGIDLYMYRSKGAPLYKSMDAKMMEVAINTVYQSIFGVSDGKEVERAFKTFEKSISLGQMVDRISKRYLAIGDTELFFDRQDYTIKTASELNQASSFEIPQYPDIYLQLMQGQGISSADTDKIVDEYERVLKKLNASKGDGTDIDMEIDAVRDWACEDPEAYWNIMYMYSSPLQKVLPPFSFILSGETRNGKSAAIELARRFASPANTAARDIEKLGDWHGRDDTIFALYNCPKEINTSGALKGETYYKLSSTHEEITFDTMRGQKAMSMPSDFNNLFASNKNPVWEGDGAQACVKRTVLIPFEADFEASDDENYSYEDEHYTHDFMVKFSAHVFAFASFFSTHKFIRNGAFLRARELMSASADPFGVFLKEFNKVFSGFQSLSLFRKEAYNFLKKSGYDAKEIPEIKKTSDIRLNAYREMKITNPADGRRYRCYVHRSANPKVLPVMFNDYRESNERKAMLGGEIIHTNIAPTSKTHLEDLLNRGESYTYIFRESMELKQDEFEQLENGASSEKIARTHLKRQQLFSDDEQ